MLRITISKNADAAIDYFTHSLKREDYFFGEKEVTAIWAGSTALQHLGLSGKVTLKDFARLMRGIHPKSGESFLLRKDDNRRASYEYTFNTVKSVSLLYAITKDPEILNAHRAGVAAAMQAIERDMQTKNREPDGVHYETSGNIAYCAFEHMTARPVQDKSTGEPLYISDPHLHAHVIVPNVTFSPLRNRLQALEEGNIRNLAPYYEAVYHSVLSKKLAEAGYPIERTKDRYEVKGVSRALIEKFSRRTQLIEKVAVEKGITDAKKKSELGAKTRVHKTKAVAENRLYQLWEQRLSKAELFHLRSIKGAPQTGTGISAKEANDKALAHFLSRKSAIPEKRVLAQALAQGYGTLLPDDVQRDIGKRDNILSAFVQTIKTITTKEMALAEDEMLRIAASSKGTLPPLNTNYAIQQDFLSEEQRKAVQLLLHSNDRVTVLMGAAGVGKTSLLSEYKNGVEQAGKQVLAFAPSAAASRGVLREKSFAGADTIALLLQNKELQQKTKDNVLLIDEAGMVGTQDMLHILRMAQQQNARVVLSGDPKQHSSVSHGDALRLLREQAQLRTAVVKTVIRQHRNEDYRKAIQEFANGNPLKAYNRLDKMNSVIEIPEQDKREQKIAADYVVSQRAGRSALVVCPTHAEGQAVTKAIREQLKKEKLIQGNEKQFPALRNLSLTDAQKQDAAQYEPGMQVRFHQNVPGGFNAGQHYRVVERTDKQEVVIQSISDGTTAKLPMQQAQKFETYLEQELPVAKGDILRIGCNGKTR